MLKNRKNKKKKGFTLIELVIVLAVMAIIALVAIPNFTAIRDNSKNKADASSLDVVERNILMLVSDGTIDKPASGNSKEIVVSFASAGADPTVNLTNQTEKTLVEEALKDVNAPQGDKQSVKGDDGKRTVTKGTKAAVIKITIDDKGSVSAATEGDTTPPTTSSF